MAEPNLMHRGGEVVMGRNTSRCIIFNSLPIARRSSDARKSSVDFLQAGLDKYGCGALAILAFLCFLRSRRVSISAIFSNRDFGADKPVYDTYPFSAAQFPLDEHLVL